MELQDFFIFVLLLLGALVIYTMIRGMDIRDERMTAPIPEKIVPINPRKKKRRYVKRSDYWKGEELKKKISKARAAKFKRK